MSSNNKKLTIEEVLDGIREVHGDKYSLTPNSKYINTNTKMELYCTRCNEPFLISPKKCKAGQGHRKCSREDLYQNKTKPFSELREKSDAKFGKDVFIYDEETYVNWNTPMSMWCRRHGNFHVPPVAHLATTYGCGRCGYEGRVRTSKKVYLDTFENRAHQAHDNKYDYSKFKYVSAKTHGIIICPEHGEFTMTPDVHINDECGCPECGRRYGKAEKEVREYIESLGVTTLANVKPFNGLEIDIYIPELNLGIEYNGLRWHSDWKANPYNLHNKTRYFSSYGIRIVHIYEDEWLNKRELTQEFLKTLIGKQDLVYNARDLEFRCITWDEYKAFTESTHLQGSGVPPTHSFGLFHAEDLVAVMGFDARERRAGEIELTRFCSKGSVRGGFTKLLKNAITHFPETITRVVSFSDSRWSLGNVYSKNGFTHTGYVKPNYWYVIRYERKDKRGFQRKYLPHKLPDFDPNLSERDNCRANGIYRIFDCGKQRWELKIR